MCGIKVRGSGILLISFLQSLYSVLHRSLRREEGRGEVIGQGLQSVARALLSTLPCRLVAQAKAPAFKGQLPGHNVRHISIQADSTFYWVNSLAPK
jgi:hypothetical protein